MRLRTLKIEIRDCYNALVGKTPLIDKYNQITKAICEHTDNMQDCAERKAILAAYNEMDETTFIDNGFGFSIGGFNPYRSPKAKLRSKIAEGQSIMKQYNISMLQKTR